MPTLTRLDPSSLPSVLGAREECCLPPLTLWQACSCLSFRSQVRCHTLAAHLTLPWHHAPDHLVCVRPRISRAQVQPFRCCLRAGLPWSCRCFCDREEQSYPRGPGLLQRAPIPDTDAVSELTHPYLPGLRGPLHVTFLQIFEGIWEVLDTVTGSEGPVTLPRPHGWRWGAGESDASDRSARTQSPHCSPSCLLHTQPPCQDSCLGTAGAFVLAQGVGWGS